MISFLYQSCPRTLALTGLVRLSLPRVWAEASEDEVQVILTELPEAEGQSITRVLTPPVGALTFSADGRVPHAADLIQLLIHDGRFGELREDSWLDSPVTGGSPPPACVVEESPVSVFPGGACSLHDCCQKSPWSRQVIVTDASAVVVPPRVESGAPVFDPQILPGHPCTGIAPLVAATHAERSELWNCHASTSVCGDRSKTTRDRCRQAVPKVAQEHQFPTTFHQALGAGRLGFKRTCKVSPKGQPSTPD